MIKRRSLQRALLIIVSFFFLGMLLPTYTSARQDSKKAILAGGCFWCMESDYEKIPGVIRVESGYIGGEGKDPTYKDYGRKGHIEAVEITYDPSVLTYKGILDLFWPRIDPTDAGGQFCDRGHEYSTAIFYKTKEEKKLAEKSKSELKRSGRLKDAVVTKILENNGFYRAEGYHQDYYKKNPLRYKFYRYNCGRDKRLRELWGEAPGHE